MAHELERAGFEVSTSDTLMSLGRDFAQGVANALNWSDAVVVLLTPASVESDWVKREVTFALMNPRFDRRLIPVMDRRVKRHEVLWPLLDMNPIVARMGDPRETAAEVERALNVRSRAVAR